MEELLAGRLDESAVTRALAHADGCSACTERLEALSGGARGEDEPTNPIGSPAPLTEGVGLLPRGTPLGRYLILERLGAGGMGEVYAAFDPQLNRKVALKLLLPAGSPEAQAEARLRLLREAQAMARLSHPNVIPVYDLGEFGERVFVAMEFIEGRTLRRWLEERPRGWREVVEVLSAAGRGLAAAHAAGLVHRDFKPDNVLIGRDERVYVLDFGLAVGRGAEGEGPASAQAMAAVPAPSETLGTLPPGATPRATPHSPQAALGTPVTRRGAVLGTPGYMAPEQYRGETASPAADQFGFCATLYLALYGSRAFAGDNAAALFYAAREGRVQAPPANTRVPAWVHQVVVRGLSPAPEARFSSVEALLTALQKDPARRRRRLLALAGAGALLLASVGFTTHAVRERAARCQGAAARLEGVWDDARKDAIASAFTTTGVPYAARAWEGVRSALDGYTGAWVEMQTQACEATRLRGEASEKVLGLRTACLEQRRGELQALTEVLRTADADVVQQALSAVRTLPELEVCADVDLLSSRVPPPADAHEAQRVEALRQSLAQARALWAAGRYKAGVEAVRPLEKEAEALGYLPVRAEVLLQLGQLEEGFGNAEAGERAMKRAVWTAEEAHADELRAEALTALTSLLGYNAARAPEAHDTFESGRALLARLRTGGRLLAELYSAHGLALSSEGRFAEAERAQREALVAAERSLGPESPEVGVVLRRLSNTLSAQGRHAQTLPVLQRALGIFRAALGGEHPRVGSTLVNLGTTYSELGRRDEALATLREGLGILERTLAPKHPFMPKALDALGTALWKAGRHEEALVQLQKALSASEAARGPNHPDVAQPCVSLGLALTDAGRPAEALPYFRRALSIQERALKSQHPSLAVALMGLGDAQRRLGHSAEALAALERALAIREAAHVPPLELAASRFALAQALWEGGSAAHPRALALAEKAEADLGAQPDGAEALRQQLAAWRAAHASTESLTSNH
nr:MULTISPECIES: serine/threonine-protein kinase [Myxococcaceae]